MKFETLEVAGFGSALKGMRNPKNSWDKSDSVDYYETNADRSDVEYYYDIGENDMRLAQSLIKAGSEHCKFLRQIQVWVDIDMPRYWWSEFDTYGFNSKNSCSTMHKLLNNKEPITFDLFAICREDLDIMYKVVERLEWLRVTYISSKDNIEKRRLLVRAKRLLPEGFLQLRTVNTNYAELRNMYHQRKNHRLKEEWVDTFCGWVETLPYAKELITLDGGE